jgi:hypothetical protein
MNDNSSALVPPPSTELRKHSPLGIASLVASVIAVVGLCLTLVLSVYGNLTTTTTQASQTSQVMLQIIGFTAICTGGAGLLGLGLGIGALFQKAQSKVFSIIGLALGAVVDLILCVILVIGLVMQGTL